MGRLTFKPAAFQFWLQNFRPEVWCPCRTYYPKSYCEMKKQKLPYIFLLAMLIGGGFLITSLTSYFTAHESLSKQISESALPLTSDNIYSEIQQDLLKPIFISSLMASDTFVRDWKLQGEKNPRQIVRYLKEIQQQYNTVTSFFVSEKTKKYYHPKGVLKTLSPTDPIDQWYYRFRDKDTEYEINIDHDTADPSNLTIFINYRVYDYAASFIGVTGVGLGVTKVQELISTYQKRYGRIIYFTDRQGNITLANGPELTGQSLRSLEGIQSVATQVLASPSGSYTFERDGKTIYLNVRLVPEFDWYLLVEQEADSVSANILQNLFGNLALSFVIGLAVIFLANIAINRYQRQLENMATTDQLTGTSNRHIFETLFEQMLKSSKRNNKPVGVIMTDIDDFKKVNDTYGHHAGDLVIRTVSDMLSERLRDSDVICRWGGEEFIILLPDCSLERTATIAEDLRETIEKRVMFYGKDDINVTASFGICASRPDDESEAILKRVDQALYKSKNAGRNQVTKAT